MKDIDKLFERHDKFVRTELLTWKIDIIIAEFPVPLISQKSFDSDENILVFLTVPRNHVWTTVWNQPKRANFRIVFGLAETDIIIFWKITQHFNDIFHRFLSRIHYRPIRVRKSPDKLKRFSLFNFIITFIDPRPYFQNDMDPRFVLQKRMGVDLFCCFIVIYVIVDCIFYDSAFDYRCNVVVPFFVDHWRFNEIREMLLGDHSDLR